MAGDYQKSVEEGRLMDMPMTNSREARQRAICSALGIDLIYTRFGKIDTLDLMCQQELDVFNFYRKNRKKYRKVVDIGANVGLHSIIMAANGWVVSAYEPDPIHYRTLCDNIDLNEVSVFSQCAAVSDHDGMERLVRVVGNTTGNHLEGYKDSYGDREYMVVPVVDCRNAFKNADFAKIDCEGHEAVIVTCMAPHDLPDSIIEIGNAVNAGLIYKHLKDKRKLFVHGKVMREITELAHMPTHHSEGLLFVGERI